MNLTTRLLILVFISILFPLLLLSFILKEEITSNILKEKEDKLFGLAIQLDNYLEGSYDDILEAQAAKGLPRKEQIRILNEALRDITDFVASGNPGVGVGYYHRSLDAVITYGPSSSFQYMVGVPIFRGHQGYEVMEKGIPMVQIGQLVRGNILNCMWPIMREGAAIGYIWSNETVDQVQEQLKPIINRVYGVNLLIFLLIYASVSITTRLLLNKIMKVKQGIETLFFKPTHHLPEVSGELSILVKTINSLVDNMNFMKSYNKYILEGVSSGVLAVSLEGIITRTNKSFYNILPYFGDDIIQNDFRDVFDQELKELVQDGLNRDIFYPNKELEYKGKVLDIYSSGITDEEGSRLGIVFVFRDITIMRRFEQELAEKDRASALAEMALGVVHEIKNPLTAIKGFTQLMVRPEVGEEKRNQYIKLIDSELNRVNRLLNEMLIYGGKGVPDIKREDLAFLIHETGNRFNWEEEGIIFEIRKKGNSDYFAGADKHKMMQVFDNILKNSLEALREKENRRIIVLVKGEEKRVVISFIDTGPGIEADTMEKIWSPFFTTKKDGTGFGLAICYKIIESHGGSIQAASRKDRYTRISLALPRKIRTRG